MGIFDFVKDAGERFFGGGDDDAPKTVQRKQRTLEQVLQDKSKGESLEQMVRSMGIEVAEMDVKFREGVATVTGAATSQADREKLILLLGNSQGVARVVDEMTVHKPEPEARMHTVVSGDTLSRIAKQYYGDARKYPVIFEANRPMLKDPNKIYPGQVLRIPPQE